MRGSPTKGLRPIWQSLAVPSGKGWGHCFGTQGPPVSCPHSAKWPGTGGLNALLSAASGGCLLQVVRVAGAFCVGCSLLAGAERVAPITGRLPQAPCTLTCSPMLSPSPPPTPVPPASSLMPSTLTVKSSHGCIQARGCPLRGPPRSGQWSTCRQDPLLTLLLHPGG